MRAVFRVILAALFIPFLLQGDEPAIKETRNVVFAKYGERELHLDWFRPDDDKVYPGVLVVHGGGWIGGDRKSFETIAKDLARAGFVVANLEYRLATEERFPGAVLDVKAAIRWMRSESERLQLDPEAIGGVGGSAGGHLIAMAASTPNREAFSREKNHPDQSDALQAAIIMGTGVDQIARVKESPKGTVKNCVIFFGGEFEEVPEVYAQGSPITHVSPDTAPILMIDGEYDRPGKRYPKYRAKLDAAKVENQFVMIPGAKHGQWGKAEFRPAFVAAMLKFLDQQLK